MLRSVTHLLVKGKDAFKIRYRAGWFFRHHALDDGENVHKSDFACEKSLDRYFVGRVEGDTRPLPVLQAIIGKVYGRKTAMVHLAKGKIRNLCEIKTLRGARKIHDSAQVPTG